MKTQMAMSPKPQRRQIGAKPIVVLAFLLAGWSSSASQTAKPPIEVPFEFEQNQIILQAKIGGAGPFNVLLDTNRDTSAIDGKAAGGLGPQTAPKGGADAGVGPTRLSLEVGNLVAKDVLVTYADLANLSKAVGKPIHGVLGYSFLKDRIVQIDYQNLKLRFHHESPYPRIQFAPNMVNTIAFPFRYENSHLLIDSVFVNNDKMKATLDTGSSGSIELTPEAVALLRLDEQGREVENPDAASGDGTPKSKVGTLKSVRLGRLTVESVQATFGQPGAANEKKIFDLSMGNGFFQDFLLTLDFRSKIVVFERVD